MSSNGELKHSQPRVNTDECYINTPASRAKLVEALTTAVQNPDQSVAAETIHSICSNNDLKIFATSNSENAESQISMNHLRTLFSLIGVESSALSKAIMKHVRTAILCKLAHTVLRFDLSQNIDTKERARVYQHIDAFFVRVLPFLDVPELSLLASTALSLMVNAPDESVRAMELQAKKDGLGANIIGPSMAIAPQPAQIPSSEILPAPPLSSLTTLSSPSLRKLCRKSPLLWRAVLELLLRDGMKVALLNDRLSLSPLSIVPASLPTSSSSSTTSGREADSGYSALVAELQQEWDKKNRPMESETKKIKKKPKNSGEMDDLGMTDVNSEIGTGNGSDPSGSPSSLEEEDAAPRDILQISQKIVTVASLLAAKDELDTMYTDNGDSTRVNAPVVLGSSLLTTASPLILPSQGFASRVADVVCGETLLFNTLLRTISLSTAFPHGWVLRELRSDAASALQLQDASFTSDADPHHRLRWQLQSSVRQGRFDEGTLRTLHAAVRDVDPYHTLTRVGGSSGMPVKRPLDSDRSSTSGSGAVSVGLGGAVVTEIEEKEERAAQLSILLAHSDVRSLISGLIVAEIMRVTAAEGSPAEENLYLDLLSELFFLSVFSRVIVSRVSLRQFIRENVPSQYRVAAMETMQGHLEQLGNYPCIFPNSWKCAFLHHDDLSQLRSGFYSILSDLHLLTLVRERDCAIPTAMVDDYMNKYDSLYVATILEMWLAVSYRYGYWHRTCQVLDLATQITQTPLMPAAESRFLKKMAHYECLRLHLEKLALIPCDREPMSFEIEEAEAQAEALGVKVDENSLSPEVAEEFLATPLPQPVPFLSAASLRYEPLHLANALTICPPMMRRGVYPFYTSLIRHLQAYICATTEAHRVGKAWTALSPAAALKQHEDRTNSITNSLVFTLGAGNMAFMTGKGLALLQNLGKQALVTSTWPEELSVLSLSSMRARIMAVAPTAQNVYTFPYLSSIHLTLFARLLLKRGLTWSLLPLHALTGATPYTHTLSYASTASITATVSATASDVIAAQLQTVESFLSLFLRWGLGSHELPDIHEIMRQIKTQVPSLPQSIAGMVKSIRIELQNERNAKEKTKKKSSGGSFLSDTDPSDPYGYSYGSSSPSYGDAKSIFEQDPFAEEPSAANTPLPPADLPESLLKFLTPIPLQAIAATSFIPRYMKCSLRGPLFLSSETNTDVEKATVSQCAPLTTTPADPLFEWCYPSTVISSLHGMLAAKNNDGNLIVVANDERMGTDLHYLDAQILLILTKSLIFNTTVPFQLLRACLLAIFELPTVRFAASHTASGSLWSAVKRALKHYENIGEVNVFAEREVVEEEEKKEEEEKMQIEAKQEEERRAAEQRQTEQLQQAHLGGDSSAHAPQPTTSSSYDNVSTTSPVYGQAHASSPVYGQGDTTSPLYGQGNTTSPVYGGAETVVETDMAGSAEAAFSPDHVTTSPVYGASSPVYGAAASPAYGNTSHDHSASTLAQGSSSPAYGAGAGHGEVETASPVYGQASPVYDTSSPAYAAESSPGYGNASPVYGAGASPTYGADATAPVPASPQYNASASSPAYNATASPTYDTTASPTYGASSSPIYGVTTSPTYNTSSPAYAAASSPTYAPASPGYGTASPAYGAASPVYGATSPIYGAASPVYGAADGYGSTSTSAAPVTTTTTAAADIKAPRILPQDMDTLNALCGGQAGVVDLSQLLPTEELLLRSVLEAVRATDIGYVLSVYTPSLLAYMTPATCLILLGILYNTFCYSSACVRATHACEVLSVARLCKQKGLVNATAEDTEDVSTIMSKKVPPCLDVTTLATLQQRILKDVPGLWPPPGFSIDENKDV